MTPDLEIGESHASAPLQVASVVPTVLTAYVGPVSTSVGLVAAARPSLGGSFVVLTLDSLISDVASATRGTAELSINQASKLATALQLLIRQANASEGRQ